MKKVAINLISLSVTALLALNSCRNKEDASDPSISNAEMSISSVQASDIDNVSSNVDDAMDKVNTDLASSNSGLRVDANGTCGYTIDRSNYNQTTSGSPNKTIVYTFNSEFCDGRTRSGTITASLVGGNFFREINAQYVLVFTGFGVTRNGETVTLNGTQTVTNVTGGLPRFVITKPDSFTTVKHKVTGEMELAFATTGATRNWNIDREITWTKTETNALNTSITSNRTENGYANTSIYGTNRLGNPFYTQILSPITANSSCGWFRPISGERKHTLLDSDGSVVYTSDTKINTGSDGCGSGFTLTTTNKKGKMRTITVIY